MRVESVESIVGHPRRVGALLESALHHEPLRDSLQRLCELAADTLDVPITFVSFVQDDELIFVSGVGLPEAASVLHAMSVLDSFCQRTVLREEPLVVADAVNDPACKDIGAVTRLRFLAYLGVPLRARDGNAVGAFCAVDLIQRDWGPKEIRTMKALAHSVSTELELQALRTLKTEGSQDGAAQRRSEFLLKVDATLTQEAPLEQRLHDAARLAVPILGDYVVIDLEQGKSPPFRSVAIHLLPEKAASLHALPELSSAPERVTAGQREGLPGPFALHNWLAMPLLYREERVGRLGLGRTEEARPYTPEERALAQAFAERVGLAIAVARKDRAMRDAVREREELISVASHELRTPLTALQLRLDSLAPMVAAPNVELSRVQRSLEAARQQCSRLAKLHDTLLDLAALSSGGTGLNLESVDLAELCRDVLGRFEPQAAGQGSPLHLHEGGRVAVRVDRTRMEQVVSNLLSNALKYGRGHPVQVRVEVSDGKAQLQVSDQGIGIAPDALQRIFGRFERAVPSQHFGGLGIGLYVAHQIVQAHGGEIWATSEPGKGSTFTLTLPLDTAGGVPAANCCSSS